MSDLPQFLKYFPYPVPREIQKESLRILQDNWNKYDVFILSAPTAYGKTSVARTIINTLRSVSVITPTNMLVQQFRDEFPDTPTLSRLDSYHCEEWDRPCPATKARLLKFCKGCKCSSELATAKFRRGPGVYNYHTYLSHKLFRNVLIVDEAHNLIPVIRDRLALRIWKHDVHYPDRMWTHEQMRAWVEALPENKQKTKKMKALREAVSYKVPEYIAERTQDWFNGKGTLRGEPELRDCIKLLPVDISQAPQMFWPQLGRQEIDAVEKVILMSATISKKDVEQLGLARHRVLYINCQSPIPAENRPIYIEPIVSVNRQNMEKAVPEIASYIEHVANQYPQDKGVIHATYQLASDLRNHLNGPRYIFHTRDNKADMYRLFRESSPESGRILVASGMYEGIDLPEDLGRWQIIAKVPWPSLANPAIKHLAELDPEWMDWETLKSLIQACGRICRTPTDYGRTFIPDKTFLRLLNTANHLFPQYFQEALKFLD